MTLAMLIFVYIFFQFIAGVYLSEYFIPNLIFTMKPWTGSVWKTHYVCLHLIENRTDTILCMKNMFSAILLLEDSCYFSGVWINNAHCFPIQSFILFYLNRTILKTI